jgi:hypothetical protein
MAQASIHQAIHGYRDGHRLLSSSTPLSTDATRAILVLSDMSGPSMQPGFDEYLTGYPLPGSEFFVLAKTWYAPEMQRPGCVWTHSLLIPRLLISQVSTACLLAVLRRPKLEGVEYAAKDMIVLEDDAPSNGINNCSGDKTVTAAVVSAVFGQPLPVIVAVETAAQFESVILRFWEKLWPSERCRFGFCTGALMPRSVAGAPLDLQAVPRAIPLSQFRRSASSLYLLDLRAAPSQEPWVDLILGGIPCGDTVFQDWLEAAAGSDAGRVVIPSLVQIFAEWQVSNWSARSMLASILDYRGIDPGTRDRLVGMVFDRAMEKGGTALRRELILDLCAYREADLTSLSSQLEMQTRRLFDEARAEGCGLVVSLLSAELTKVGEGVLRDAALLLAPSDLDVFEEAQAPILPTIVGANPMLAVSPGLWIKVGSQNAEVLSKLGAANLSDEERGGIIDAILLAGHNVPVDALLHFGGRVAIFRCLSALAIGQLQLSWQWRSSLSSQPESVLDWLEGHPSLSLRELELGSRILSPKANHSRLVKVWQNGTASGAGTLSPRNAAFGLALAFAEGDVRSLLLRECFQPTYDAAGRSQIEYEEWDWLREYAPAVSWWRDWDKCERLAAVLAGCLVQQGAPLETVFSILKGSSSIRKVVSMLEDNKGMRPYLKSLRKSLKSSPNIGTREQRDALI